MITFHFWAHRPKGLAEVEPWRSRSLLPAASAAHATSAYLPAKGQLELTVGTKYEDYDRAWQGTTFNRYTRVTTIQEYHAAISYGITDRLSLEANGGYGTLTGGLGGGGNCATLPLDTLAGRDCQSPIPQGTRAMAFSIATSDCAIS